MENQSCAADTHGKEGKRARDKESSTRESESKTEMRNGQPVSHSPVRDRISMCARCGRFSSWPRAYKKGRLCRSGRLSLPGGRLRYASNANMFHTNNRHVYLLFVVELIDARATRHTLPRRHDGQAHGLSHSVPPLRQRPKPRSAPPPGAQCKPSGCPRRTAAFAHSKQHQYL